MKTVAYLHGLNHSPLCFEHLLMHLPEHNIVRISYDSHAPLASSLKHVISELQKYESISLVGHSLGGLISTLVCHVHPIEKLAVISSPIAGSAAAKIARWLPKAPPILKDIIPTSPFILQATGIKVKGVPALSICSTDGNIAAAESGPNDGIVTIESQKSLPFGKKVEVKANHFEVLLHPKTIELLSKHLFEAQE